MSDYMDDIVARRNKANRLKAREQSLKSGRGCLVCPASVLCLANNNVTISRCAYCGTKTVYPGKDSHVYVLVGSDIECWAVTHTTSVCDACSPERRSKK